MRISKLLPIGIVASLCLTGLAEAKERLLFVPIDNRPVCLQYIVDSVKAAGWDILTPPEEYIASYNRNGDPDKLYAWLEENALVATDAVVSSDSLIYGGLVPSRTHHLSREVLESRTRRLLDFKKKFNCLRLHVFGTVMRSPRASSAPAEPAYYSKWGPKIFRLGELSDKEEMGILKRREKKEKAALLKEIPASVRNDVATRRKVNLDITKELLRGVETASFDYFLLGRDDTAVHSDAHRDARQLEELTKKLPEYKIRFFAGADQLGLILLNRAINKIERRTPIVYTFYNEGVGENTIPSYEDDIVKRTVNGHVLAAGGFPASSPERADLIMGVYTPRDGRCREVMSPANSDRLSADGKRFVDRTESYVRQGRNVGIADIAFGNGSSKALVNELFRRGALIKPDWNEHAGRGPALQQRPLAWLLGSYAGWNTASNTIGYTLGQGLLRPYLTTEGKNELLTVRYLDEWAYEAQVRDRVRRELIYPRRWTDGALKPRERGLAEEAVSKRMGELAVGLLGSAAACWEYDLPWSRMFEVRIKKVK